MGDVHTLPLRGHDMPRTRLFVKARVFKDFRGWTWQHQCDHTVTKVSLITMSSQALAFQRAQNHMRWCL